MAAQISALPTPPSRQDPTNFNDRADAFLGALPAFQSQANALSTEVNDRADTVEASADAVLAATNITKWVSGTTYAQGAVVWSPINGLGYRRITASGSGTTDPSSDSTNYKQVNGTGDVSTSGDQTIAGSKTFTGTETTFTGIVTAESNLYAYDVQATGMRLNLNGEANFTEAVVLVDTQADSNSSTRAASTAFVENKVKYMFSTTGQNAPVYAARAWVNFNGTGTVAIRASGNVTSITDNDTGDYTVNFTTAMPDANYSVAGSAGGNNSTYNNICFGPKSSSTYSTTAVQLLATVGGGTNKADVPYFNVVIFR